MRKTMSIKSSATASLIGTVFIFRRACGTDKKTARRAARLISYVLYLVIYPKTFPAHNFCFCLNRNKLKLYLFRFFDLFRELSCNGHVHEHGHGNFSFLSVYFEWSLDVSVI